MLQNRSLAARLTFLGLFVIAILGAGLLLWSTRSEPLNVVWDSAIYKYAGETIAAGRGSLNYDGTLLTHYPPFYPAALAVSKVLGSDLLAGARWLHALLYASLIMLAGLLAMRLTPGVIWPPLLAAILVALAQGIEIYRVLMSESLFLPLLLLGLLLLSLNLDAPPDKNPRRAIALLLTAAVVIGFSAITRYVGLAFIGIGGLSILLLSKRTLAQRVVAALVFGLVSITPIAVWLLYAHSVGTEAREFAFHPISLAELQNGVSTIIKWFLPSSSAIGFSDMSSVVRLAIFGVIALIVVFAFWQVRKLIRRSTNGGSRALVGILLLTIPVYIGFLITTISFFDDGSRLDQRLLLPVNLAVLLLVVYTIYTLVTQSSNVLLRLAALGVAAYLIVFYALVVYPKWTGSNESRSSLNSAFWTQSDIIDEVRKLPADTPITTNVPVVPYGAVERVTFQLPEIQGSTPDEQQQWAQEMRESLAERGGYIFYIYFWSEAVDRPIGEQYAALLNLETVTQTKDGAVYRLK